MFWIITVRIIVIILNPKETDIYSVKELRSRIFQENHSFLYDVMWYEVRWQQTKMSHF